MTDSVSDESLRPIKVDGSHQLVKRNIRRAFATSVHCTGKMSETTVFPFSKREFSIHLLANKTVSLRTYCFYRKHIYKQLSPIQINSLRDHVRDCTFNRIAFLTRPTCLLFLFAFLISLHALYVLRVRIRIQNQINAIVEGQTVLRNCIYYASGYKYI